MKALSFIGSLLLAIAAIAQPTQYSGKIGKYPVHMRIEQKGNKIQGGYVYDKHGLVLLISGTIAKGTIVLSERDETGYSTGTFSGKITGNDFTGSWKPYPKAPPTAFKLTKDIGGSYTLNYVGAINNKYRIQMKLTRKGSELSGMYYYEKQGIDIPLRGTMNPDESFTLDEFTVDGELQGTFVGKLAADFSLSGTWSKPSGTPMPFTVKVSRKQVQRDKEYIDKGSAEVFARVITYPDAKGKIAQTVVYPQLRGLKDFAIQQKLNKLFLPPTHSEIQDIDFSYCKEFESERSFTVRCNSDSIISIEFNWYEYSCGAHPNHGANVSTYDLRNGQELHLPLILKPGALKSIAKLAEKKILQQYADFNPTKLNDILFDETLSLNDSTCFIVHKDGLTFHYDPYEIAPYAAGDIDVEFLWSELDEFVLPESPVRRLYKK